MMHYIKKLIVCHSFEHFPWSYTSKTYGKAFGRGHSPPRHRIIWQWPPCPAPWPSATTVARTSQESPAHTWEVHGASQRFKILQDRYLAKLMANRWISCSVCYITFKTRFSFNGQMTSSTPLLATGPAGVEGRFLGEFMILLDGSSMGIRTSSLEVMWPQVWLLLGCGGAQKYKAKERERGFEPVRSVIRLSILSQRLTSTKFGSTVGMCLSERVVARSSRPTTARKDTRSLCVASLETRRTFAIFPSQARATGWRSLSKRSSPSWTWLGRSRGSGCIWPPPWRGWTSLTTSMEKFSLLFWQVFVECILLVFFCYLLMCVCYIF